MPSLKWTKSAAVSPSRHGFTLVELLVVIAIIGILIGLLVPAIQYARGSARMSACKAQMREIGIALDRYLEDKGVYPKAAMLPSATPKLPTIYDVLYEYAGKDPAVFKCPSDYKYAEKEGLSYEYPSIRLAGKSRVEAQRSWRSNAQIPSAVVLWLYEFEDFHDDKRNYLFADGHVEAIEGASGR